MKLYRKIHHSSPLSKSQDYDSFEPFEISEEKIEEVLYKFSSSQKDIGESLYLDIAKAIINLLK